MTNMTPLTTLSESSTLIDVERFSNVGFSEWGFTDGAQNNIFANDNGNSTNMPTSTPIDKPSSTPVDDKTTPTPTPTPGTPPIENAPEPSPSKSVFLLTVLVFGIADLP